MNSTLLINFTFAGTTVDPAPAKKYLLSLKLGYYEQAYRRGESERVLDSLLLTEAVEIALRRYMAGHQKTLHKVFARIREFCEYNSTVASGMISIVILTMRREFLRNEWYELIPRLEKAAARVERLLA